MNQKQLELEHFEPGNILYEWNVLCDEKIHWHLYRCPSFQSFEFNKTCLINLKIIPTQAGLGIEGEPNSPLCLPAYYVLNITGKMFVRMNLDVANLCVRLAIDEGEENEDAEFKAGSGDNPGYYYAEGPEFRVEYIHSRVEY